MFFKSKAKSDMDIETAIKEWPFARGESPFKIRGSAYIDMDVNYTGDSSYDFQKVLSYIEKEDPPIADFLKKDFFPTEMYDIFPLVKYSYYNALSQGEGFYRSVADTAANALIRDLTGFYKVILAVVGPVKMLRQLAKITSRYFNFSPPQVEFPTSKSSVFVREDFPVLLLPWYMPVSEGYGKIAVEKAGAKNVKIDITHEPTGKRQQGVELCTFKSHLKWE